MTAAITAIWKKYPVTSTSTQYYEERATLEFSGTYPPPIAFDHTRISPKVHNPITLSEDENLVFVDIALFRLDNIRAELKATPKKCHKHTLLPPTHSTGLSPFTASHPRFSEASSQNLKILAWGGYSYNDVVTGRTASNEWVAPDTYFGHTDPIYRACLACGLSPQEARGAASHAMDPDGDFYGPPIIDAVLHGHDHYLNPQFNTGRAATNAQTAADAARSFVAGHPQRLEHLGLASHYLTDLSNPMHTGGELRTVLDLAQIHTLYETVVGNHWREYCDDISYQSVNVPSIQCYSSTGGVRAGAEELARTVHPYWNEQFERTLRSRTGDELAHDPQIRSLSRSCILSGYIHSINLVKYVYQR